jgi:hypothetical protein
MQLADPLQAIRPCRESGTRWTRPPAIAAEIQISLELNEHGPALKVFWSCEKAGWAQSWYPRALAKINAWGYTTVDQKNGPEGASLEQSDWLLSVRKLEN